MELASPKTITVIPIRLPYIFLPYGLRAEVNHNDVGQDSHGRETSLRIGEQVCEQQELSRFQQSEGVNSCVLENLLHGQIILFLNKVGLSFDEKQVQNQENSHPHSSREVVCLERLHQQLGVLDGRVHEEEREKVTQSSAQNVGHCQDRERRWSFLEIEPVGGELQSGIDEETATNPQQKLAYNGSPKLSDHEVPQKTSQKRNADGQFESLGDPENDHQLVDEEGSDYVSNQINRRSHHDLALGDFEGLFIQPSQWVLRWGCRHR